MIISSSCGKGTVPAGAAWGAPGRTPAGLIAIGYDIEAAVTGGLWLQKDRDVFYCNSGGRRPLLTLALPTGFC